MRKPGRHTISAIRFGCLPECCHGEEVIRGCHDGERHVGKEELCDVQAEHPWRLG
jgi:hypothetical protein